MDPVQHLAEYLRSRAPLPQAEIDLICSHFQVERVQREMAVVTQGRRYTKLVFVVEGILRVFVHGPDGEDIVKNFVEANDFFADVECLEKDQPAVVNLSAITDCTLQLNRLDKTIIALNRPYRAIRSGEERLGEMLETLRGCKRHAPETSALLANVFGSMLHGPAMKTFKGMDARFVVHESCKGCGTCVKVCPRGNVHLENGRPAFSHNCELCHACIQWCPQFAIRHPDFDADPRQYRNPAVHVSDLVRVGATGA